MSFEVLFTNIDQLIESLEKPDCIRIKTFDAEKQRWGSVILTLNTENFQLLLSRAVGQDYQYPDLEGTCKHIDDFLHNTAGLELKIAIGEDNVIDISREALTRLIFPRVGKELVRVKANYTEKEQARAAFDSMFHDIMDRFDNKLYTSKDEIEGSIRSVLRDIEDTSDQNLDYLKKKLLRLAVAAVVGTISLNHAHIKSNQGKDHYSRKG